MVTLVKGLHIAALLCWAAGLVALPLMLAHHRERDSQSEYARLRLLTHYTYIALVTPAAVLAIGFGTALIFLRQVFEPWLFVKLLVVGALVALHVYVGHTVLMMSERKGTYRPLPAWLTVGAIVALLVLVLGLVLAKPALDGLDDLWPAWLREPRHRQLPVDETPI